MAVVSIRDLARDSSHTYQPDLGVGKGGRRREAGAVRSGITMTDGKESEQVIFSSVT